MSVEAEVQSSSLILRQDVLRGRPETVDRIEPHIGYVFPIHTYLIA